MNPLVADLANIVGRKHVLTSERRTRRYRLGYRFGGGPVLAVVRPGTLVEQWRVLQACVAAQVIVIAQAANTGLTGGSTPDGDAYDRPIILLSTLRIDGIHLIDGGRQVVCLAGATLGRLEALLRPLNREPHSVIGSSCIGASVVGGVCNGSGGALVQRGPAYTELALFAQIAADGTLLLVNHLGIALGNAPETILERLDSGAFGTGDVVIDDRRASDRDYAQHVRDVDADTPARFNANPRTLFEASGSAGKVILFAVRLDTFAREPEQQVFYVGSNNPAELEGLRRHFLAHFTTLPIAAEYIHREAFDIAERYGKDVFLAVRYLGAARLPRLFAAKAAVDGVAARSRLLPSTLADHVLQFVTRLLPTHLPPRMREWRDKFEHHLILRMAGGSIAEAEEHLNRVFPSPTGAMFRCTPQEGEEAFIHRFAVAGAAVRYRAIHRRTVEDIVALDIALPRNTADWFERLPDAIGDQLVHRLYYGHFFCHVLHQDYLVAKGHDAGSVERAILGGLNTRGAIYPAEHNVGHLYRADATLAAHYRALDPTNSMNVGIGGLPRGRGWRTV